MTLVALLWIGVAAAVAGFIWLAMSSPSNAAGWPGFVLMCAGFGIDLVAIMLWGSGMIE